MPNNKEPVVRGSMSIFVFMKLLESAPSRYDWGIRILTFGRLTRIYDRLTSQIRERQAVLDIGCGTGALTLRAAQKGARVKGIDINPQMLEIARRLVDDAGLAQNVELREMGVTELEAEKPKSYDVVMSGLCFSELTEDELAYTLKEVTRILKHRGLLLIADEVVPSSIPKKVLNWVTRFPLMIVTYFIAQTTTHAVKDLREKVEQTGMQIKSVNLNRTENFVELIAVKPGKETG